MGHPFIVNINCFNILHRLEDSTYTMFIDDTKMSIVYELKEWIRWIFSFEGCFDLVQNKSVIHELEDIRILSNFKTIEVKPCKTLKCYHKKISELLSNTNFFVQWNGTMVPKILLQKLNQVEHKLNKSIENSQQDLHRHKADGNINKNLNLSTKLENFSKTDKSCILNSASSNSAKSHDILSNAKTIANNKTSIQSDFDNDVVPDEKNNTLESTKSKLESDNNKNFAEHKKTKYCKPFSLGAIMTKIRSEAEKKTDIKPFDLSQNSMLFQDDTCSKMESDDCKLLITNDSQIKSPPKKRKRTRTKKKKKFDECKPFDKEQENSESFWNSRELYCEAKPSHIRFDIDDNTTETENSQYNKKESQTFDNFKELKNNKPETVECLTKEELFKMINDKKQAFSSSPSKNETIKCDVGTSETNISSQAEKYPTALKNQNLTQNFPSETFNANCNSWYLGELFQLREKFQSPVVFERF